MSTVKGTEARTPVDDLLDVVSRVKAWTPPDDVIADAIGDVRSAERTLADVRRTWERVAVSEYEPSPDVVADVKARAVKPTAGTPVVAGRRWAVVPKYRNDRTYNTPAILAAFAAKLGSVLDAVVTLIDVGAVSLSWKWTALQHAADRFGVPLRVVRVDDEAVTESELDLDSAMVIERRVPAGVERVPLVEEGRSS